MLRKEKCVEILERRLKTFSIIDDTRVLQRFYDTCCGIVWFLEATECFSQDDTWAWIDKFANEFNKAWLRINGRFDR